MKSTRGQGLLETVLALPIAFMVASALIVLLYRSIVYHVSDYQAHEALICTQSAALTFCKREIESRLKPILVTKPSYKVQLHQSFRSTTIQIEIELSPPLKIEKTLPRI